VLLQRERRIQHGLDALHPMLLDRLLDLARVIGSVLDDVFANLALASPEHQVVTRKVGVSQDVGRHEYVLGEAVTRCEVGVAGVAGKHHLEEAGVAHVALDQLVDVPNTERPVRHPHRQSIDSNLHHETVGDGFELDWMKFESRTCRQLLDALCITLPVVGHRRSLTVKAG